MVERENTWPTGDHDQETSCPNAMRWPGIGIDKNFDDRGHDEKSQRSKAAREPDHQQERKKVLGEGSNICCQSWIDQRQSILVLKQCDRILRHVKTLDFCLPRPPKYGGWKYPGRKRDQGMGGLVQNCNHGTNRAHEP